MGMIHRHIRLLSPLSVSSPNTGCRCCSLTQRQEARQEYGQGIDVGVGESATEFGHRKGRSVVIQDIRVLCLFKLPTPCLAGPVPRASDPSPWLCPFVPASSPQTGSPHCHPAERQKHVCRRQPPGGQGDANETSPGTVTFRQLFMDTLKDAARPADSPCLCTGQRDRRATPPVALPWAEGPAPTQENAFSLALPEEVHLSDDTVTVA